MDVGQPPEKKTYPVHIKTSPNSEDEITKQNKAFFDIRGKLKANTKREDRIAMLTFNKQSIPEGNSEVKQSTLNITEIEIDSTNHFHRF